jgi:hypothetical protein
VHLSIIGTYRVVFFKDFDPPFRLESIWVRPGVKVVLLESSGTVIGNVSAEVMTSHPEPGWSEQDAGDRWMACNRRYGISNEITLRHVPLYDRSDCPARCMGLC